MDADETDAPETLLSLRAAAARGLRSATVKQYILRGQLAAVRVPCGHATRLFVAPAELERYRRASLGAPGASAGAGGVCSRGRAALRGWTRRGGRVCRWVWYFARRC